jgi:23S rRNA pseudouridine2605 synthase
MINNEDEKKQRLQKIISKAGIASRRKAEELITQGRVSVNGKVVDTLGARANPEVDDIMVDGEGLYTRPDNTTYAFNKPKRVLSCMEDKSGRETLKDYLEATIGFSNGIFHVGRLDYETQGLILLTTDGDLANKITHPSYEVKKVYLATVDQKISNKQRQMLLKGVSLEDGISKFDDVKQVALYGEKQMLKVTLHSGKNRIIRRTFDAIERKVCELVRTEIGPIQLGNLKPGAIRELNNKELNNLKVIFNGK